MHTHHHDLHHYSVHKELNELYFNMGLRAFALSLLAIFIPLYLLDLGYTLKSVLWMFALWSFIHLILTPLVAKCVSKYGIKHTILFSLIPLIVGYLALYSIETYSWPLWLISLLFALSSTMYWFAYHLDFSKFSNHKKRGKEIGKSKIITALFLVAGPAAGGFLATTVGFQILFLISILILMLSSIPLFMSQDVHEPIKFSLKDVFKGTKIKDFLSFFALGFESGMTLVIWPIFLYMTVLTSYKAVGLVYSVSLIVSLVAIFFVAKLTDVKRRLTLKVGAVVNSVVWIVRSFVKIPLHAYAVDSFYGASKSSVLVPFDAIAYDKANESKDLIKFTMFRELSIHTGRTVIFLVMIPIANLVIGFYLAAGISLLYLLF